MSNITIGRAGVAVPLIVTSWDTDGPNMVKVSGLIRDATSVDQLTSTRDQILGLANNPDEPEVPVAWDLDDSQTGFYRVLGASVGSEPRRIMDTNSVLEWSVDLERVDGYQAPLTEVLRVGAIRTNGLSYTNGVAVTGLPGGLKVPKWTSPPTGSANYVVSNGSLAVFAGPDY